METVDLNADPFASTIDAPYYGNTKEARQKYADKSIKAFEESFVLDDSSDNILARLTMGTPTLEDEQKLKGTKETIAKTALEADYGLTEVPEFGTSPSAILEESYKNLSSLKSESPEQFTEVFTGLTAKPQLSYLYKELQAGNIDDKQYAETAFNFLRQENPSRPYFIDDNKVYTWPTDSTSGTPREVMLRPKDVWNMPAESREGRQEDYFLQNIGNVGRTTTDFRTSLGESILTNPVVQIAGSAVAPLGLGITAAKAAAGYDVSPMEIASSLLTGLEMSGAIKAPTLDAMPEGQVGTPMPNTGTGLFGSTYGQTQTALNVAAAGDAKGAALALVGDDLITGGLDKVGLDQATIENAGIQYDDFQAGVGKVVSEVAGGADLDDALVQGLGKYIREGGTLGSVDLPSVDLGIDLSGLKDVIEPIVETVEDIGRPIVKLVEDAGRPIVEAAEDVARPVGDVVEDVAQGAGDVLSDLDTAVRQALPDVDLPSLDLNLGGLLTGAGAVAIPQLSATRTTDDLFKDELFKFQTEIGVDVEPLEYVDLNAPAENFFEDPILGRSYNF